MMTRLRQCSTEVIGRIKKMFTCLIKEAFRYRFEFQCPKYLCRARDLFPPTSAPVPDELA